MKRLLYVLAISLVVFSCNKPVTTTSVIQPVEYTLNEAFDSMNLSIDTLYHLVFNRQNVLDSHYCMRFLSPTSFIEYHTFTDTNGILYLLDSLAYGDSMTYSQYQQPDPANYVSTIGYVYTNYFPSKDTIAEDSIGHNPVYFPAFPFHNYLTKDTLQLYIGTLVKFYAATGTFKHVAADSPNVTVTFYKQY